MDRTSQRQDAAAYNAEIGFVPSSTFSSSDDERRKQELARHLANVKNSRYTPTALTKFVKEKSA